jgi:NAD(P)-dependent dehydrogenase (short-subunit alcohol dehydrogenase family)
MAMLAGKCGVVTGSAQGIGRACAIRLAAEGASVVVADILDSAAEAVADEITRAGGKAIATKVDVTVEADVVGMLELCRERFGGLDFLHQNAAVQIEKRLHETSNEEWDRLHAANLKAMFWGAKGAVQMMIEIGRGGSIVNTASVLSFAADPILAVYGITKHGVLGLTRAVATDSGYSQAGIRCNCVCPGDIATPMVERYWAPLPDPNKARAMVEAHYPGNRIGTPEEVASVVAFLISDQAAFVNGAAWIIDGGVTNKVY